MVEIWEQQPGESSNAFAAFLFYRESMPPRSVLKSYRAWSKDPKKKKASGRWIQWARDHKWAERATAFDKHLDSVRTAVTEKVVAEIQEQRVREIEMSALTTLKETAALAHSRITDFMQWDAAGNIKLKPSDEIPEHLIGAISEVSKMYDKQGNPHLLVKLHPKVRPLDLLGQNQNLWEDAKEQAQKSQTNAFLDFLSFIKSGGMRTVETPWPKPSLQNPPPGIVIDGEVVGERDKKK